MVHPLTSLHLTSLQHFQPHSTIKHTMNKQPHPQPHPQNHRIFDPWNSSASGHQRADGPSLSHTTAWRETRTEKLGRQFTFGDCRVDDNGRVTGEWTWVKDGAAAAANADAKRHGCQDIRDFMAVTKKRKISSDERDRGVHKVKRIAASASASASGSGSGSEREREPAHEPVHEHQPAQQQQQQQQHTAQTLAGTTIYINGSTMPPISDHKLKHLLVAHGAKLSLALARNSVTHVIIGRPATAGKGAGGGLAATKLQKEIDKCGRGNIKVVGVEWALESIKAEKRLSESKFAFNLAPKGQRSVLGMFR